MSASHPGPRDAHDLDTPTHAVHADVGAAPPVTPTSTARVAWLAAGAAVVLVVLLLASFFPRQSVARQLAAEAGAGAGPPIVQVAPAQRAAAGGTVELPGTIVALHESAIYARVAGYVKRYKVDIGALVHAGDVLAEIDAPELVHQVDQGTQQLAQANAALGLAKADVDRWRQLVASNAVTHEEYDQKKAAYDAAVANVSALEANLRRLVDQEAFTKVRAPFTGIVTARNVDIGSLITAAGATSAPVAGGDVAGAQGPGSLFRIAQTDTVRTYIQVPEGFSSSMKVGLEAQVVAQAVAGRTFTGRIVRTSRAIEVGSRTLLTEVDIANPGYALLPGMYAQVRVNVPHVSATLVIPATALVIRSAGTQVMTIDTTGAGHAPVIRLLSVGVGRDYGARIEIVSGLAEGTIVVTNPNADLAEGTAVRIAPPSEPEPKKN
ncbi:MAG: efflux RND transporter periplasmic adaptor subunit [Gemmatimonadetes bacterium]|nr:efflux RND transporter periplasmic adaptor subunit [Gemmatimonadota bacterium]